MNFFFAVQIIIYLFDFCIINGHSLAIVSLVCLSLASSLDLSYIYETVQKSAYLLVREYFKLHIIPILLFC